MSSDTKSKQGDERVPKSSLFSRWDAFSFLLNEEFRMIQN